jgi:asparagine synthase (glutamine-hydrolysing)
MCGIGAVFGQNLEDGEAIVRKSLGAVKHRGYSLYETASFDNCALGANRLEIVDAAKARQPQTNEDKTAFVVFNGEIFNHHALRAGLSEKGHKFRTKSDTEVLVHLWEQSGPEMVKKLDSEMFAFFIYDKRRKSFFAARDPYGVKPLYYAHDSSGNLHFASEIKQLAQFDDIAEVHTFPPGHYMLDGKFVRYHVIPDHRNPMPPNVDEIVSTLRKLFDSAVKKRVDTDLPIGVFFSGGLDSASILATARKYHKDVTALTVGKPDSPDVLIAKRYCGENGIPILMLAPPGEEELAKLAPEIVRITESFEPMIIRHSSVSYFVSLLARRNGFRVVLCGEGSDELFAGYPFCRHCPASSMPKVIYQMVERLPRTQFLRVDRTSMCHTVETRLPFFDTEFADYAMRIPAELKLRQIKWKKIGKWIWKEAMRDRLPDYILERKKLAFGDGAGYGNETGSPYQRILMDRISDKEFRELSRLCSEWNVADKEAAYYLRIYDGCLFTKARFNRNRLTYLPHSLGIRLYSMLSRITGL